MKRTWLERLLFVALVLTARSDLGAQTAVTGTWVTYNFGGIANLIDLQANGTTVTGTISRNNEVSAIYDGSISGSTVTFKATSGAAAPARIITYTGRITGDQIAFTRSVQVLRQTSGDGAGIYGSRGPMEFMASRDASAGRSVVRPLLGLWRLDTGRSTFGTNPAVRNQSVHFAGRPDGEIALTVVFLTDTGAPGFTVALLGADGRDHPSYGPNSVAAWLDNGALTANTFNLQAVSDGTFDLVAKTNGGVTATRRLVLSADGNTMTETLVVTDALGQNHTSTLIYDRHQPGRPQTE